MKIQSKDELIFYVKHDKLTYEEIFVNSIKFNYIDGILKIIQLKEHISIIKINSSVYHLVKVNNFEIFKLLYENDFFNNYNSILRDAVYFNRIEIIKYLIEKHIKNDDFYNIMIDCVFHKKQEIFNLIIDNFEIKLKMYGELKNDYNIMLRMNKIKKICK